MSKASNALNGTRPFVRGSNWMPEESAETGRRKCNLPHGRTDVSESRFFTVGTRAETVTALVAANFPSAF